MHHTQNTMTTIKEQQKTRHLNMPNTTSQTQLRTTLV